MRHFSLAEWVDFVRDVVSAERRAVMQGHLDSGCPECATIFHLWTRFGEIMRRESSLEPSEKALRAAKASYAAVFAGKHSTSDIVSAELVFDSALQPATAGVRAIAASGRQMLYRAGGLHIDLRLDHESGAKQGNLVGQILNSAQPGKEVGEIPVVLLRGDKALSTTATNALGEFQLAFELSDDLQILFGVHPKNPVIIRLKVLDPSASSA